MNSVRISEERKQYPQNINLYGKIQKELQQIEKLNHELLSISEQIGNMSFMMQNRHSSAMLLQEFEKEIKHTLSQVIENIKQFYLDIDKKMRNTALALSQTVEEKQPRKDNDDFRYNVLFDKIKNLEFTLQKTQENETKLLNIIDNMMQKYEIVEQPTLLRNDPGLRNRQESASMNNLFRMHTKNSSPPRQERSIHENLYLEESVVSNSINSLQLHHNIHPPEDQVYIKKLFSKTSTSTQEKKSLKSESRAFCGAHKLSIYKPTKQSTQIFEDKKHRLNFMMDRLKK